MLRPRSSKCLLCSFRAGGRITPPSVFLWPSQQTASITITRGKGKSDGRPARMGLAEPRQVGNSRTSSRPSRRAQDGPFGGMNLKVAGIRGIPERARLERDSREGYRGRTIDKRGSKDNRGFKALKMQRSLAAVSYDQRGKIKERMAELEDFEAFPLLDLVRSSIQTQALDGMTEIAPTPVQKIAIPALLGDTSAKAKAKTERESYTDNKCHQDCRSRRRRRRSPREGPSRGTITPKQLDPCITTSFNHATSYYRAPASHHSCPYL
jgi:ATP-dependent RNA helicase MRH4